MVRDTVTAFIALLVSLLPIALLLAGFDSLLNLDPYHYPLVALLYVSCCLSVWAAIALGFARLTGSMSVALFRTALVAFPITLAWPFLFDSRNPVALWAAASAPLATAMLAHAARLALVRYDEHGKPVVTKDDIGRAAASHAMAAVGALGVISTLKTVTSWLTWMERRGGLAVAELWVWIAIVLLGLVICAIYRLLSRAPGFDVPARSTQPVESYGAGITLGLLAIAWVGWNFVAIRYAHKIGPQVLSGALHLAILLLVVLFWIELDRLLKRWRSRYGGQIQLDAFGCALLVVFAPLLLWAAFIVALLGGGVLMLAFCFVALVAFIVGAALAAYYLQPREHEPLARTVACALGPLLIASILALWRLPASVRSYDRDHYLWMLIWIVGGALVLIVGFILERHGAFSDSGGGRTTRNSRIDDGDDGDTMHRE